MRRTENRSLRIFVLTLSTSAIFSFAACSSKKEPAEIPTPVSSPTSPSGKTTLEPKFASPTPTIELPTTKPTQTKKDVVETPTPKNTNEKNSAQGLPKKVQSSPTLKSQLNNLVVKANASWPARAGSYKVYGWNELQPKDIYFYEDQLKIVAYEQSRSTGQYLPVPYIVEKAYIYKAAAQTDWNTNLAKLLNVKEIDWYRVNGGYEKASPTSNLDTLSLKSLFTDPLTALLDANNGLRSVTYDPKSEKYNISGTCKNEKCATIVSFNPNGTIKFLDQTIGNNAGNTFMFTLQKPTEPFIDRNYVYDYETRTMAKYD